MRLPGTVVATLDGMIAIDTLLAALEPLPVRSPPRTPAAVASAEPTP
jgi:hypothetical protein